MLTSLKFGATAYIKVLQLVVCPDSVKDRQAWLLENIPGAEGLLCMLSDKVSNSDFMY